MASFTSQVEAIAGDSSDYTTFIPIWLNEAARHIVDYTVESGYRGSLLCTQQVGPFSSTSGYELTDNAGVLRVWSDGITCVPINPLQFEEADRSGSMYERGPEDPAFIVKNGKIYVAGGHASLNYADIAVYGTIDDSAGTIDNFPKALYTCVVMYTAYKLLSTKSRELIEGEEDIELAASLGGHAKVMYETYMNTLGMYLGRK